MSSFDLSSLFFCTTLGFGRTGKLFGFCHAPSVVPDIVSFAKGVNGAFLPLGGVALRDHMADHFRKTKRVPTSKRGRKTAPPV